MTERDSFRPDELGIADWQYAISHKTISGFSVGDVVFLKSNPEVPMEVIGFIDCEVMTYAKLSGCAAEISIFPPWCILQYKYASLLCGRRKYLIFIN